MKTLPVEEVYDDSGNLLNSAVLTKLKYLNNFLNESNGDMFFRDEQKEIGAILNGMSECPNDKTLVKKGILFYNNYVIKRDLDTPDPKTGITKTKHVLDKLSQIKKEVYCLPALCSYKYITAYDNLNKKDISYTIMKRGVSDMSSFFNSGKSIELKDTLKFCLDLIDTLIKLAKRQQYYTDIKLDNIAIYIDPKTNEKELFLIDIESITGIDTVGYMTYHSYLLFNTLFSLGTNKEVKNILNVLYSLCVTIFMLLYLSKELETDFSAQTKDIDKLLFDNPKPNPNNETNQFDRYLNAGRNAKKDKPNGTFVLEYEKFRGIDILKNTFYGMEGNEGIFSCLKPFFDSSVDNIKTYDNNILKKKLEGLRRCISQDYNELKPDLAFELRSLFQ